MYERLMFFAGLEIALPVHQAKRSSLGLQWLLELSPSLFAVVKSSRLN